MSEDEVKALVPRPSGELQRVGSGPGRLLSRVVSDALGFARSAALQGARFRLGDFEFREPDYRQIEIWAECLGVSADEVLRCLMASSVEVDNDAYRFRLADGSIEALVFDASHFDWPGGQLNLSSVPRLVTLWCNRTQLTELNLWGLPELQALQCVRNQLTELELSGVAGLEELWCYDNQLTWLDLSGVPELQVLGCGDNRLSDLDLSSVPGLNWLNCDGNKLTQLDLSNVPWLSDLTCGRNRLTELDLSVVPELTRLVCWGNKITQLDVRANLKLKTLSCDPWVEVRKLPDQVFSDA